MKKWVSLVIICVIISSTLVLGQEIPLMQKQAIARAMPDTNADLVTIDSYADKIKLESDFCTGKCVDLSCSTVAEASAELRRLEELMIQLGALDPAGKPSSYGGNYVDSLALWQREIEQSELKPAVEQEVRTRNALAVQDYFLTVADDILRVATITSFIKKAITGGYDPKKIYPMVKSVKDGISSIKALKSLYKRFDDTQKAMVPPELKRLEELESTLKSLELHIASSVADRIASGKSEYATGKIVADIAKIYAQKNRMERAQRLIADQRSTMLAGTRWELAYSSFYAAQLRRDKIKETYAKIKTARNALNSKCLSYCKGLTIPSYDIPVPKTGTPEPSLTPSATNVLKVAYYGDMVRGYNNWLASYLHKDALLIQKSFQNIADSLVVSNDMCPIEKCDILRLYAERSQIASGINRRYFDAVNLAKIKVLNDALSPYDARRGMVVADDLSFLNKISETPFGSSPVVGCPFVTSGVLQVLNKNQAIDRLSSAIDTGEQEIRTLRSRLNWRGVMVDVKGVKITPLSRISQLETMMSAWRRDLERVQQMPDITATITESLSEKDVLKDMEQMINSFEAEAKKWQQDLDFIEKNAKEDPELESFLTDARSAVKMHKETISRIVEGLKKRVIHEQLRNDPGIMAAVQEYEGIQAQLRSLYASRNVPRRSKEVIKATNERIENLEEESGGVIANIRREVNMFIINAFPDATNEELFKIYDEFPTYAPDPTATSIRVKIPFGFNYLKGFKETVERVRGLAKPPVCEDTDGGLVYDVKGEVIIDGKKVDEDSCGRKLREVYCEEDGSLGVRGYNCGEGMSCVNGACIADEPVCSDTDGGKVLEKRGELNVDGRFIHADSCVDNQVKEGYCTNGKWSVELLPCAEGFVCNLGACVEEPTKVEEPPSKDVEGDVVEDETPELFDFPSEYSTKEINPLTNKAYEYHPEQLAHLLIVPKLSFGNKLDYEKVPDSPFADADRDAFRYVPKFVTPNAVNKWGVYVKSEGARDAYVNLLADIDQSDSFGEGDWLVQNEKILFEKSVTKKLKFSFLLPEITNPDAGLVVRLTVTPEPAKPKGVWNGNAQAFASNMPFAANQKLRYAVKGGESESYLIPVKKVTVPATGCFDADGGNNKYDIKGDVYFDGKKVHTDSCKDSAIVLEGACWRNDLKVSEFKCRAGESCHDGMCLPEKLVPKTPPKLVVPEAVPPAVEVPAPPPLAAPPVRPAIAPPPRIVAPPKKPPVAAPPPPVEKVPPTIEEVIDLDVTAKQTKGLAKKEKAKLRIKEEEHTVTVETVTEETVTIVIASDPISLDINVGEFQKVDIDGDGVYDLMVTYRGLVNGTADIVYEKIEEEVPALVEEQITETEKAAWTSLTEKFLNSFDTLTSRFDKVNEEVKKLGVEELMVKHRNLDNAIINYRDFAEQVRSEKDAPPEAKERRDFLERGMKEFLEKLPPVWESILKEFENAVEEAKAVPVEEVPAPPTREEILREKIKEFEERLAKIKSALETVEVEEPLVEESVPEEEVPPRVEEPVVIDDFPPHVKERVPAEEAPAVEKLPVCEDTDGGKVLNLKGNVRVDDELVHTDSCEGVSVREGFCTEKGLGVEVMGCEEGMACRDGVCVVEVPVPVEELEHFEELSKQLTSLKNEITDKKKVISITVPSVADADKMVSELNSIAKVLRARPSEAPMSAEEFSKALDEYENQIKEVRNAFLKEVELVERKQSLDKRFSTLKDEFNKLPNALKERVNKGEFGKFDIDEVTKMIMVLNNVPPHQFDEFSKGLDEIENKIVSLEKIIEAAKKAPPPVAPPTVVAPPKPPVEKPPVAEPPSPVVKVPTVDALLTRYNELKTRYNNLNREVNTLPQDVGMPIRVPVSNAISYINLIPTQLSSIRRLPTSLPIYLKVIQSVSINLDKFEKILEQAEKLLEEAKKAPLPKVEEPAPPKPPVVAPPKPPVEKPPVAAPPPPVEKAPVPEKLPVCEDTDGGKIIEKRGDVLVDGKKVFTDRCIDFNVVQEGFCTEKNTLALYSGTCSAYGVCREGACVKVDVEGIVKRAGELQSRFEKVRSEYGQLIGKVSSSPQLHQTLLQLWQRALRLSGAARVPQYTTYGPSLFYGKPTTGTGFSQDQLRFLTSKQFSDSLDEFEDVIEEFEKVIEKAKKEIVDVGELRKRYQELNARLESVGNGMRGLPPSNLLNKVFSKYNEAKSVLDYNTITMIQSGWQQIRGGYIVLSQQQLEQLSSKLDKFEELVVEAEKLLEEAKKIPAVAPPTVVAPPKPPVEEPPAPEVVEKQVEIFRKLIADIERTLEELR